VLVARPPRDAGGFPAQIAVGIDGSPASRIGLTVAAQLGARLGCAVVAVGAEGASIDFELPTANAALHVDERGAVEAFLAAGDTSDLLVLGASGACAPWAGSANESRTASAPPCWSFATPNPCLHAALRHDPAPRG
jgi:hypothetical protein